MYKKIVEISLYITVTGRWKTHELYGHVQTLWCLNHIRDHAAYRISKKMEANMSSRIK
jgi:hypothetical protein